MQSQPRPSTDGEPAHFPRAVPCFDHSFDETLVCRCGVSWWTHQRQPASCPLNSRGRNRGEESAAASPAREP
ncbi:MAG: hypothetical protein ACQGVK_06545 [Myxococcota bacterium]